MKPLLLVSAILGVLTHGGLGLKYGPGNGPEGCEPEDADIMGLAELNIFQTASLQNDELSEEVIEKELGDQKLPADYSKVFEAKEAFQREIEQGTNSPEYGETGIGTLPLAEKEETDDKAHQAFTYYTPVCPYRYQVLFKTKWFFYQGGDPPKYCWAFHDVYGTSCTSKYCNWSLRTNFLTWATHYRCFPEKRIRYVYARCATITASGIEWTNEFVRYTIPSGCTCKKLALTYTLSQQCPVDRIIAAEKL